MPGSAIKRDSLLHPVLCTDCFVVNDTIHSTHSFDDNSYSNDSVNDTSSSSKSVVRCGSGGKRGSGVSSFDSSIIVLMVSIFSTNSVL